MGIQTNVRFDEATIGKLKVIAFKEFKSLSELLHDIAEEKIKKFEKANGQISADEVKKVQK